MKVESKENEVVVLSQANATSDDIEISSTGMSPKRKTNSEKSTFPLPSTSAISIIRSTCSLVTVEPGTAASRPTRRSSFEMSLPRAISS